MRCLYCGKELALLKRLTGGGEFCSDAHKQSYQEEYNRLALSRLLQAQKKTDKPEKPAKPDKPEKSAQPETPQAAPVQKAPASPPPPPPPAPLAVPEPVVAAADPVPAEAGLEAVETAGFFLGHPSSAVPLPDETPYLEPWLAASLAPAVPSWNFENGACTLEAVALLRPLQPNTKASPMDPSILKVQAVPQEFTGARANPRATWDLAEPHRLPSASHTALEIPVRPWEVQADGAFAQAVDFEANGEHHNWRRLELPAAGIDYPAHDSDVFINPWPTNGWAEPAPELVPAGASAAAATLDEVWSERDASPRTALEALSRLHQDLIEQEESSAAPAATLVAEPVAEPVEVVQPEAAAIPSAAVEPEPTPGHATELCDLPVKLFAPAKASVMAGEALPSPVRALSPRLKELPLRPKMAPAPEFVPQTKPAAAQSPTPETKSKPEVNSAAKPLAVQVQPVTPLKPAGAARVGQPKAPVTAVKNPQPSASPKTPEPDKPGRPVTVAKKVEAAKPEQPVLAVKKAEAAKAERPAPAAKAAEPAKPSLPAPAAQAPQPDPVPAPTKSTPPLPGGQPEARAAKAGAAEAAPKPAVESVPRLAAPRDDEVFPTFGSAQLNNTPFLSSVKVKIGAGVLAAVLAGIAYFGFGANPHKAAGISSDGAGPSIIMGEGGWVEGWAGDPTGMHAGRTITIYRPSLKLSDYRIEIQGTIDTKSLGWVFRAADPENYYAMKLATVSSGLSSKAALYKYIVQKGRQTQVGRVPIELAVRPDTSFNIRVDARGPQFTTYIQGQQVDVWTDDQLKTGGVGLLNEREERGRVKSVSIRYLNGTGK